jgi:hypothetical protein
VWARNDKLTQVSYVSFGGEYENGMFNRLFQRRGEDSDRVYSRDVGGSDAFEAGVSQLEGGCGDRVHGLVEETAHWCASRTLSSD